MHGWLRDGQDEAVTFIDELRVPSVPGAIQETFPLVFRASSSFPSFIGEEALVLRR